MVALAHEFGRSFAQPRRCTMANVKKNRFENIVALVMYIMRMLRHTCHPPGVSPADINIGELHKLVETRKDKKPPQGEFGWTKATWTLDGEGALCYTTSSGRMQVRATDTTLTIGLYSPGWRKAREPYFVLEVADGEVKQCSVVGGAGSFVEEKPSRLNHIWHFIRKVCHTRKFPELCDPWTFQVTLLDEIRCKTTDLYDFPEESQWSRAQQEIDLLEQMLALHIATHGDLTGEVRQQQAEIEAEAIEMRFDRADRRARR